MCGKLTLPAKKTILRHYEAFDNHTPDLGDGLTEVYTPGDRIYIVGHAGNIPGCRNEMVLGTAKWGFQPETGTYYNARLETLTYRPLWEASALKRRCIVPVRSFFEKGHQVTTPQMMSVAAIWRKNRNGDFVVAVVTTASEGGVEQVHHRMPLLLTPTGVSEWLDPALDNPKDPRAIAADYQSHPTFHVSHRHNRAA